MMNGYLCSHSYIMIRKNLLITALTLLAASFCNVTSAQCIVINEILIDGPGSADGQAPNSEEWIELYNTCNTPVDISCFALADGDFVIRIPAGSIIPAQGYFTIGSPNSAIPLDLDQTTCGCANPANQSIIFTNGTEQLVLLDNNGQIQDAVIWGGGQALPFTVSSAPAGCSAINTVVSNANANFETLPLDANDGGCSYARLCDGSATWELRCGTNISADASNGEPFVVDFDASASIICEGECISFSDLSVGGSTSWNWTFTGAATTSSSLQNPNNICYNTPGNYSVTLTASNGCSNATLTVPNFIQVTASSAPIITANGPTSFCEGDEVTLSTLPSGNYQWFESGNPIANATSNSITVNSSGIYTVAPSNGSCGAESNPIQVNVFTAPFVDIIAEGTTQICTGQSVVLSTNINAEFQWLESGNILLGQDASSFQATEAGNYSLLATENGCTSESNVIIVEEINLNPIAISSTDDVLCLGESTTLSVNSSESNFVWYLNNQIIPGESSNTIVANEPGTYFAEVINATCPITINPIDIIAGQIPTGFIAPLQDIQLCEGTTAELSLTGNFSNFNWTLEGIEFNNTSTTINVSQAGNYSAIVASADGCEVSLTEVVSVVTIIPEVVVLSSSEGNNICQGNTTDIIAPINLSNYQWALNNVNLASTASTLSNQGIGNYTLNALDANGCEVSADISIVQSPNPVITINPGSDVVVCAENVLITATGGNVYQWFFNGDEIIGENGNTLSASESGNYYASSTNAQGCSGQSVEISIFLEGTFDFEIIEPTEPVCEGGSIVLSLPQTFSSYSWSTGQTTNSITVTQDGGYSVQVTNSEGCSAIDDINISFVKIPEIELISTFRSDCVNGTEVVAISEGLISWEISPFITLLDNNRILANPESSSTFNVTSTIGECESQTSFQIIVECPTLFIPNVFTPNDDGVNDFFRIEGQYLGDYEMIIFNRWGDEIYRSNDSNRGWNGGINGYYAPDGTYNYVLKIQDQNGQPLFGDGVFYGTVTLLR